METVIQYGGRGAGAFLAYRFLSGRVGGGAIGIAAVVALGWLAGGLAGDLAARQVAPK